MHNQQRPIFLTPSPKAFFRSYIVGFLLSPFLIGLYLLWKTELKRRRTSYRIGIDMLTIVDGKYSRNIDLDNISNIEIRRRPFNIGTLIVSTSTRNYSLVGLQEPERIAEIIMGA
ncbi:hypothetical protein ACKGJO_02855 [Gracilimonas sp. Q87]|uniref:hypothetical protein n=1 Tax=Gracilimonas sp. Q87 TaxID=3384766 RepID=UPI00398410C1